jgi:hypothetical protein
MSARPVVRKRCFADQAERSTQRHCPWSGRWARQGSNLRPLGCKASRPGRTAALPASRLRSTIPPLTWCIIGDRSFAPRLIPRQDPATCAICIRPADPFKGSRGAGCPGAASCIDGAASAAVGRTSAHIRHRRGDGAHSLPSARPGRSAPRRAGGKGGAVAWMITRRGGRPRCAGSLGSPTVHRLHDRSKTVVRGHVPLGRRCRCIRRQRRSPRTAGS